MGDPLKILISQDPNSNGEKSDVTSRTNLTPQQQAELERQDPRVRQQLQLSIALRWLAEAEAGRPKFVQGTYKPKHIVEQESREINQMADAEKLAKANEVGARNLRGFTSMLMPSTYIGPGVLSLFNDKSYGENFKRLEGFGNDWVNFAFDLTSPFLWNKGTLAAGTLGRNTANAVKRNILRRSLLKYSDFPTTDGLYFIRNTGAIPEVIDGKIYLSPQLYELTNMTLGRPFSTHKNYKYRPGTEYYVIEPKAFEGRTPLSIQLGDTFFENLPVDQKYITIVTGNPKQLALAQSRGFNVITNDEIQNLYKYTMDKYIEPVKESGLFLLSKGSRTLNWGPYNDAVTKLIQQRFGQINPQIIANLERMTGLLSNFLIRNGQLIYPSKSAREAQLAKKYYFNRHPQTGEFDYSEIAMREGALPLLRDPFAMSQYGQGAMLQQRFGDYSFGVATTGKHQTIKSGNIAGSRDVTIPDKPGPIKLHNARVQTSSYTTEPKILQILNYPDFYHYFRGAYMPEGIKFSDQIMMGLRFRPQPTRKWFLGSLPVTDFKRIQNWPINLNKNQWLPNNDANWMYTDVYNIPLTLYHKKGGQIHIKKKNRGKFTEYCGGKVTDECINRAKNSGNPKLVKRAVFALNAKKWNK